MTERDGRQSGQRGEPLAHAKIEANIDDMSPEAFDPLIDRLFTAGASDVFVQPIMMKKSRPAQLLSVLCEAHLTETLGEIVLNHSSTIGLRIFPFEKMTLPRTMVRVPTSAGEVSAKVVVQPNGVHRFKSEHDEIVSLANDSGESYLALNVGSTTRSKSSSQRTHRRRSRDRRERATWPQPPGHDRRATGFHFVAARWRDCGDERIRHPRGSERRGPGVRS